MTNTTRSPLSPLHDARGARFADGGYVPNSYADAETEDEALRKRIACCDLSDIDLLELSGADAVNWFHGFCTQDIKSLKVGEGAEAFCTNVKARVLAFVVVLRLPDRLWLLGEPDMVGRLMPHLAKYVITEDVTLTDRTGNLGVMLVRTRDTDPQIGSDAGLPAYGHAEIETEAGPVRAVQLGWLSEPHRLLIGAPEAITSQWEHWSSVGTPVGRAAFERLRIQHGFPKDGVDVTEAHLAPEANRNRTAISYRKGCYLGQEPIARLDALGHTNKVLVLLHTDDQLLTPGTELKSESAGAPIGTVTSSAWIASLDEGYAFAYVKTPYAEPGQEILIAGEPVLTLRVVSDGFTLPGHIRNTQRGNRP